ncbi:unnamed protein product [Ceratitis capitata]|uniref:(Mediterranean fruit fly) hypothetical protein n=1 Tax=Ceratitis capitata TaxID=7213 RepID=A0A811V5R0_CERCA|nr:unnamed protein product [Ceratitis capitata]
MVTVYIHTHRCRCSQLFIRTCTEPLVTHSIPPLHYYKQQSQIYSDARPLPIATQKTHRVVQIGNHNNHVRYACKNATTPFHRIFGIDVRRMNAASSEGFA